MIDPFLIELLNSDDFVSGEWLAQKMDISRAAVWKKIKQLNAYGVKTESLRGQGYRLDSRISLIDEQRMKLMLSGEYVLPVHIERNMITRSTNEDALALLTRHEAVVVCADMQTGGKGRRGRNWVSPFGTSLYLSVGRVLPDGAKGLEGLSLAVGIEVASIVKQLGVDGIQIKWPNDLVCAGAKLGGILIELSGDASGGMALVVGVGLNLRLDEEHIKDIDQKAADLYSLVGVSVDKTELASRVGASILRVLEGFPARGFDEYADRWQQFDACFGRKVNLIASDKTYEGIADGVNDTGALRLITAEGIKEYYGGEISLRFDQ